MDLQETTLFLRRTLGETLGFIALAVVFDTYFPVFIVSMIANAVSMGIFSMLTDGSPAKDRWGAVVDFPSNPDRSLDWRRNRLDRTPGLGATGLFFELGTPSMRISEFVP